MKTYPKLIPLRIPACWVVRWNQFNIENKSEDLLWVEHVTPGGAQPDGLFIDVGFYQNIYRAVMRKDNWEGDPRMDLLSEDVDIIVEAIEEWMINWSKYSSDR